LILFCLISCIEEIDFKSGEETGILVVDATLSTASDSNLVRLSRTAQLGRQVFPPETGAMVMLFDQTGNSERAADKGDGTYWFSANSIGIKTGGTYHLEIETADGLKFISDTETIRPAPPIDSLTFSFSVEQIVKNETQVLERSFFNLYVHGSWPANPDQTFLKWDVEHVFLVSEIQCSPIVGPKSCYIYRPVNVNEVLLLDGTSFVGSSAFSNRIAHQELDHAFGLAASFFVSQKSLTESSYNYWARVRQVVNDAGTIFDTPPAAIPGNLYCISDPNEQVLGNFSAVDEKTEVVFITRGDLGSKFSRQPFCGENGLLPADIDLRACCNCLTIENSTRTRPFYWP
jgi:hypothetical protein